MQAFERNLRTGRSLAPSPSASRATVAPKRASAFPNRCLAAPPSAASRRSRAPCAISHAAPSRPGLLTIVAAARSLRSVTSILVLFATLVLFAQHPATAQEVIGNGWENIPGLGPVNLGEVPEYLRGSLRRPGTIYYEDHQKPALDLPPLDSPELPELFPIRPSDERPAEAQDSQSGGSYKPRNERIPREQVLRWMYEERALPNETIPPDAYRKAWEDIQKMPAAELPNIPALPLEEPVSRLSQPRAWFAFLWNLITPSLAEAQTTLWAPIGPGPFRAGSNDVKNAGIVCAIAVDPQNTSRIYLATVAGGVWKTSNGGLSWAPTSDAAPSLQNETVAVHPTNSALIFTGTGLLNETFNKRNVGTLRSNDTAASWSQTGPTWCIQPTGCHRHAKVGRRHARMEAHAKFRIKPSARARTRSRAPLRSRRLRSTTASPISACGQQPPWAFGTQTMPTIAPACPPTRWSGSAF